MGIYEELQERGLIAQVTDEAEIRELVNSGKAVFYIGFDPTADSLHVGHFMTLVLMKRLQQAGNRPIALVGGGTGMIGDPSGRTDLRKVLTVEDIDHNVECFKKQMSRFIEFGEDKALLVNNADWIRGLNYIELLRDVGACFSVNKMLTAVNMQFGGDDQWSNMLAGTELIRKKTGKDAYALTITLLLNSEGNKMGKTASGAVWLDPNKTSPFEFFQYWRNVADADVIKCFKLLTFVSIEEIKEMEKWDNSRINDLKELLAFELTKMVHGEEEAIKAKEAARALFSGQGNDENMPTTELESVNEEGELLLNLLIQAGLTTSKGEGRRLVEQGGLSVNGEKVTDPNLMISKADLVEGIKVKKGKKIFHKIILK